MLFSNANLETTKLSEHYDKLQIGEAAGIFDTLKSKRARLDQSGTKMTYAFVLIEEPLLMHHIKFAYLCAKRMKPHTVAEKLVKP